MAGKSTSKIAVWILLGLLILGLGGFGVTGLSGSVRTIGAVGETEIGIDEYARGLQSEIRALEAERGEPVSFLAAREAGLDTMVLRRLVAEAALTEETRRLGLSIGDRNLRERILDIPGFRGLDGDFDRDAYSYALEQQGMSEAEFEEEIRAETARTLLQGAAFSGLNAPETYTDTLLDYVAERRDISFAVLGRGDLSTGLPEPDDADLQAWYDVHEAAYTAPETKRITYALLSPEMLIDTVEVDEAELREAYEARSDEYSQPERRLVERLVFPDAQAAEAAQQEIEAGGSFDEAVAARGLDLSDVDLGDVARDDLTDAAGEAVFAAQAGDVVGPVPTDLGPALFRVNAVFPAQTTPFEDARPDLRDEIAAARARRVIDTRIEDVDNLLAGGATIEEVAGETDLEQGQIDWHPGIAEGIGAYEEFRQAARQVTPEDYPEVITLEDGGIFAMRVDEVIPPTLRPLDEVREQVRAAWTADAVVQALRAEAADAVARLESGESFADVGLSAQDVTDLTRRGFQPDTPRSFIETVFEMDEGAVALLDGDARLFVLRLDAVKPPAEDDADLQQLRRQLAQQASSDLAQDMFQLLAEDIRARAGVTLDQQALNAVHANF